MNTQPKDLVNRFDALLNLAEEMKRPHQIGVARLLRYKASNPEVYVSLAGETSAGKSTLINSLINEKLLPVGVKPTTGMVSHFCFSNHQGRSFEAINKDGSVEEIDAEVFHELNLTPDEELMRLVCRDYQPQKSGLNLFDTPGYNSLTPGHQEVLESFLGHSDVILFTCNYRVGFNQSDQELLTRIKELVDIDDTPIFLVLNRAPSGCGLDDKRTQEIKRHAEDCLGRELPTLFVNSRNPDEGLPHTEALWTEINDFAQDPQRQEEVYRHLLSLGEELLDEMSGAAEQRVASLALTDEERQFCIEELKTLSKLKGKITAELERFDQRMRTTLPKVINRSVKAQHSKIVAYIDTENKWLNHENCASYVEVHAMPELALNVSGAVQEYLLNEVEKLNEKLEDLINTSIKQIGHSFREHTKRPDLGEKLGKMVIKKLARVALNKLLLRFGGVGGAAAGAGNIVKMGVKRAGGLFGKKFGREVYNEIGRRFTQKALQRAAVAAGVVIEAFLYLKEVFTWQRKLKERLAEQLEELTTELTDSLLDEELNRIVESNKSHTFEVVEMMRETYQEQLKESEEPDRELKSLKVLIEQMMTLKEEWRS